MIINLLRVSRSSIDSLFRFIQGFLRFDLDVNKFSSLDPENILSNYRVISIDLFDTLLLCSSWSRQYSRLSLSQKIVDDLDISGLLPKHVLKKLDTIEANMRKKLRIDGFDPEFSRRATYAQILQDFAFRGDIDEKVRTWICFELQELSKGIVLNPLIVKLIEDANSTGIRIIAISDMYFSSQELSFLLNILKAPPLSAIYASSDIGLSKFRGGLFKHVMSTERINSDEILHIGDNRWSDVYSARQKGIRTIHLIPSKFAKIRLNRQFSSAKEYNLGYRTLGPIFAYFSHILLNKSVRMGNKHLAFIARDGDLLKLVTECLALNVTFWPQLTYSYLYLSRCSTSLPSVKSLDKSELAHVSYIRAGGSLLYRFIDYYGLSTKDIKPIIEKYGLNLTDENIQEESLSPLLDDPDFKNYVEQEKLRQTKLLKSYLNQHNLFNNEATALVDIGWRGTIQTVLNKTFPNLSLKGLYLAYWSETGEVKDKNDRYGVIGDIRRNRTLLEGSAWYAAFILEAICRENCGTVTGYQEHDGGDVHPIFKEQAINRNKEIISESIQKPIRQGILDYIEDYAFYGCSVLLDENKARFKTQIRLFRLAFFPSQTEIEILGGLWQTEGHATNWGQQLIVQNRLNLLFSPRLWLTGLTSPWRFGYIAATGGFPLVILFMCIEAILIACPYSFRSKLRNFVLTLTK